MTSEGGRPLLGLLVNPVAGMGGAVGLKGTDGPETLAEALRRGAVAIAVERAERALRAFARESVEADLIVGAGPMGDESARAAGFSPRLVGPAGSSQTSAEDTRAAARAMAEAGVDLLLFAGGDGTACDIHDAIGDRCVALGLPTGVKMQSAVFAVSPEAAGRCAAAYLAASPRSRPRDAEVLDLDEEARRAGRIAGRLHGVMRVPNERRFIQSAKVGHRPSDGLLKAACMRVAQELRADAVTLIGPGTTTRMVLGALGLKGSLLGVDAVVGRQLVGRDLSEAQILALIDGREAALIIGVSGGQGALFGRGNQPIGPAVLMRIPRERINVLAALDKLAALQPPRLIIDSGDPAMDASLAGYWPVTTGPGQTVMMRAGA